ncbi:DUF6980 family protein [Hyphomicrobium methylovorum]|uniref:DUF6980 family protein n=1 Tax=Hyphomicrobium methylovorum TaxID=84 RepID=UPI003CCDA2BF
MWTLPPANSHHCCASMTMALQFSCDQHPDPFDCPDALLIYNDILDEYGIVIHDGSASYLLIDACPWCGTRLPESARDKWFDAVDALNLADGEEPPREYLTSAWRRGAR